MNNTVRKKLAMAAMLIGMTLSGCADSSSDISDSSSGITDENASSSDNASVTDNFETEEAKTSEEQGETQSDEDKDGSTDSDDNEAQKHELTFSKDSGLYSEEFELEMFCGDDNSIYYTIDGSDPKNSSTAILYSAPVHITSRNNDKNVVSDVEPVLISGNFNNINKTRDGFTCDLSAPSDADVDKCTVIRAVVKDKSGEFKEEKASTYFIGTSQEHIEGVKKSCEASGQGLSVISISMDYDDLFGDEKGIYVKGKSFDEALEEYLGGGGRLRDPDIARRLLANYSQRGKEWEREAVISYFEFDGEKADYIFSQQCGIRIQGNYSRSDLQKGFRLYARKEYGDNNFRYPFFGDDYLNDSGELMDKFKTLVLRAGGNCAFSAKFNDTFWQSLLEDTACETKKSRPCIVYLNGEYWGLYVLEEDYSADYFEDVHNVNKDDVVVYKGDAEKYECGYKLDIGKAPEGEEDDYYYRELLDFFKSHRSLRNDDDYNEFVKLVDPDSVLDYFAAESWINNKWDWPGKNWSMWKTKNVDESNSYADGRWRFMFYDVEFGGVSGSGDAYVNTIKEDNYKPNGLLDMDTENPAVLTFAYLMTNDGFRERFCERLSGLSEDCFEKNAALNKLDYFENVYSPLYDQFFKRYPGTGSTKDAVSGGYSSIKCIRDFLELREDNIDKMIDFCNKTLG